MVVHFHDPNQHPHNTPIIDLDFILPAIEQVKDNLTEMNIHAIVYDGWATERQYPLVVKGSAQGLASFHQLKKLTIPLAFLTGFDPYAVDEQALVKCLSQNLEFLTINIATPVQPVISGTKSCSLPQSWLG